MMVFLQCQKMKWTSLQGTIIKEIKTLVADHCFYLYTVQYNASSTGSGNFTSTTILSRYLTYLSGCVGGLLNF
jgi:hypothetical protein